MVKFRACGRSRGARFMFAGSSACVALARSCVLGLASSLAAQEEDRSAALERMLRDGKAVVLSDSDWKLIVDSPVLRHALAHRVPDCGEHVVDAAMQDIARLWRESYPSSPDLSVLDDVDALVRSAARTGLASLMLVSALSCALSCGHERAAKALVALFNASSSERDRRWVIDALVSASPPSKALEWLSQLDTRTDPDLGSLVTFVVSALEDKASRAAWKVWTKVEFTNLVYMSVAQHGPPRQALFAVTSEGGSFNGGSEWHALCVLRGLAAGHRKELDPESLAEMISMVDSDRLIEGPRLVFRLAWLAASGQRMSRESALDALLQDDELWFEDLEAFHVADEFGLLQSIGSRAAQERAKAAKVNRKLERRELRFGGLVPPRYFLR